MYELKKEDFKRYEKGFKETYIGKQLFLASMGFSILTVLCLFFMLTDFASIAETDSVIFLVGIISGIGTVSYNVLYQRELTHYVRETLEKEKKEKK